MAIVRGNARAGGEGVAIVDNGTRTAPVHGHVVPRKPAPGPSSTDLAAGMQFGAAMTPDYSGYLNEVLGNIGTQRAAIDAHLAAALTSLGQRRDAAAKTYAALPGQLQNSVNFAQDKTAMAANEAAMGLSPDVQADKGAMRDFAAQNAADINFAKGGQPLLGAANTANYTVGADRLNAEAFAAQSELANQEAAARADVERMKQSDKSQLAQFLLGQASDEKARKEGYAHDTAMAQLQHKYDVENAATAAGMAESGNDVLAKQGITAGDEQRARSSQTYQGIVQQINSGADPNYIYWQARQTGDPKLLAVLASDYPQVFKTDPTTGQPTLKPVEGTSKTDFQWTATSNNPWFNNPVGWGARALGRWSAGW